MTWIFYNNGNKFKQPNSPLMKTNKKNRIAYFCITLLTILTVLVLLLLSRLFFYEHFSSNISILNLEQDVSFHTVSENYLSFAIDASLFRKMNNLPILNKKMINLARHLSPAYVRFGGTSADCLFFNETLIDKEINFVNGEDISKFTISEKDFQSLYEFSTISNLKMIFDLNALIRNSDGSWNDSNAKNIILFAKKQNMNIDWQLGNEPPNFPLLFNLTIPPEQLAKDYRHLRFLLDSFGYKKSILVGPEVNQIGGPLYRGENYTLKFLENAQNSLNYITWHQYYLRGEDAKVEDFINVTTFEYLPYLIKSMQEAVDSSGHNIPMWLSETSTAFDGGAPGISDRFIAGFLFLDKLGYSASVGLQVVIRQSFFGGNYAMVGPDLMPNPDWWVSVIYKKFVSNKVLNVSAADNSGNLRLYMHCSSQKVFPNSLTIFGVNINKFPRKFSIANIPVFSESAAYLYALTSDDLLSRSIQLNGKVLKLLPDGNLPQFKPISLRKRKIITAPAYSMIFLVVQNVNISVCLNSFL